MPHRRYHGNALVI